MPQDISQPDPTPVLELLDGFRRSKAMFAGVSLGVFDALEEGPQSAAKLASRLKCHPEALERLLSACVGLQLLQREGEAYANTPTAKAFLTQTSPRRMTGYINFANNVTWRLWERLEDAVREGSHRWPQVFGWEGPIFSHFFRDEHSKREFLMGMHGFGVISSPQVVSSFDLSRFTRLVDLGGATGHLAIAACQRYPALNAVVFDLPQVIPLAREIVAASPVSRQIEFVEGNFFTDAIPQADLYSLGRILHDWSEEKIYKLLTLIYDRLPVGGGLLIAEKLLWEDKSGPSTGQLQDLNMLSCTEGRERSLREYESVLARVGFRDVVGCRTSAPVDAVLALK